MSNSDQKEDIKVIVTELTTLPRVGLAHIKSVHDSDHNTADRIFLALPESHIAKDSHIRHSSSGRRDGNQDDVVKISVGLSCKF